jgi:hypothetical protein
MPSPPDDERLVTSTGRIGRRLPDLRVAGLDESEIFALAPAFDADRIHWTGTPDVDLRDMLATFDEPAWTRAWGDGQPRIWVVAGRGEQAREWVRTWLTERGLDPVNLRVEKSVTFRELESIPEPIVPELIGAAVDWLYPRTGPIRYRLAQELEITDEEDVRSLMYLFVHDLVDRYDDRKVGKNGRVNFLTFVLGKLRNWPQDVARAQHGKVIVADRVALSRADDQSLAANGRIATEQERADALGITVTELRERHGTIAALAAMRYYTPLDSGADNIDAIEAEIMRTADTSVDEQIAEAERNAALTRALVAAVHDPAGTGRAANDPLALAAVYLTFWEGRSRGEVAEDLGVSPKVAGTSLQRVMEKVDPGALALGLDPEDDPGTGLSA